MRIINTATEVIPPKNQQFLAETYQLKREKIMNTLNKLSLTILFSIMANTSYAAPDDDFEIYKYICVVSGQINSWGYIPGEFVDREHAKCTEKGGTFYTRSMGIEPAE